MLSYTVVVLILIYNMRNIIAIEDNIFQGFNVPCQVSSPQCIKESAQAIFSDFVRGIPSLGIEPLDPIVVDKMNLAMPGGLTVEFNGQTKGLKKCAVNSVSISENRLDAVLHCNFTIKGKYRSYGKMLMFPIDGNGDATIVCKNLKLECSFKLDTTEINGKKYLVIKDHDIRHSYQGQVFYKITNLVKGHPEISNTILEFMNRNWLAVAEEFGDPVINVGIQSVIRNVQKFIQTVAADQLLRQS